MRRSVPFLGRKWEVVDFVDKTQPPESHLSDGINKMLVIYKIASYVPRAFDIMNFVLDSLFIKKLFDKVFVEADIDDGTDDNGSFFDVFFADTTASGRWMLITTISSAATTMVFGPILLKLIERYDPNKYDLTQVDMVSAFRNSYYAHWAFIEVSTFLVEDVTTLCIYHNLEIPINELSFLDIANIVFSLFSGLISSIIMYHSLSSFSKEFFSLAIIPTIITLYAAFLAIFMLFEFTCIEPGPEDSESWACILTNYSELIGLVSAILGMLLQFQIFSSIFAFALCSSCAIVWPTPNNGLVREGRLPLARTRQRLSA